MAQTERCCCVCVDRFDADVQDDIEENAVLAGVEQAEPMFSDSESLCDNVGDQDDILDV